ncbi:MAG: PP2C family protein-serine/threonine phosphatase [Acidimicrobiia bacterium]
MTLPTANPRQSRWMATIGVLIVSVLALASLIAGTPRTEIILQGPAAVDPNLSDELAPLIQVSTQVVIQQALHVSGIVVFIGLAILLVLRKGTSDRAPLGALTLVAFGTSLFAPLSHLPAGDIVARVIGSVTPETFPGYWGSLAGLVLLGFLATFPDGRWTPFWTRRALVAVGIIGIAGVAWPSGPLSPHNWPAELQAVWLIGLPTVFVAAQLLRMRRTRMNPAARNVVLSLLTALAAFVLLWVTQPELTQGALELVVVTPRLRAAYALNILVLLTIAVFSFPVSVSFSIVRYRLFDVDLLINRAIVYGAATSLVGLSFLALALALSLAVSGQLAGVLGVALGALVVLVFQPLRHRVQRAVDRRFYRERYDARQVIEVFANDMTRLIDPAELEAGLVASVEKALRPVSVRIHPTPVPESMVAILNGGSAVEVPKGNGEDPTGPSNKGGNMVLVPLYAGGLLTGVLELGERSSGSRYSRLDLDLLDRLAKTAGPALQLAHEVETRERNAIAQQRAANELELARKIQQGLLPHHVPDLDGWMFEAYYRPAREVGGDFYDWIDLPDRRLGVVIGDVSDKGIPAALVMATCRALLRSAALAGLAPGAVLAEVNDRLHPDVPSGMFVTCLIAYLEPATGDFTMANAGHNLPFASEGDTTDEITVRGMPLGLMGGMVYEQVDGRVSVGGSLILTSDGLAESHSAGGEMYGTGRLRESLAGRDEGYLESALDAHRRFVGADWEQEDDMTLVTVNRGVSVRS